MTPDIDLAGFLSIFHHYLIGVISESV